VLVEIPVGEDIKKALLGKPSRYRPIFEVVLDYESGTWEQLAHSARHVGLHEEFPAGFVFALGSLGDRNSRRRPGHGLDVFVRYFSRSTLSAM
jgi:hypothetical protein